MELFFTRRVFPTLFDTLIYIKFSAVLNSLTAPTDLLLAIDQLVSK